MQLPLESCACGHSLDQHEGGRGAPCSICGCAAAEPPTAFQVGVIHSMHEMTTMLARLLKEMQAHRGVK